MQRSVCFAATADRCCPVYHQMQSGMKKDLLMLRLLSAFFNVSNDLDGVFQSYFPFHTCFSCCGGDGC